MSKHITPIRRILRGRILRGGSWNYHRDLRAAICNINLADDRNPLIGFRVIQKQKNNN